MTNPLSLEAIYYASPIPENAAVLTMMGLVFDKIHFPGVGIPIDGFDPGEVAREIARLEALGDKGGNTEDLIAMMRFIEHAKTLEGFCVFPGETPQVALRTDKRRSQLAEELYDAIHGPRRPGWTPMIEGSHFKGLPGGEETLIFPGTYAYLAGSVLESERTGLPLLVDKPKLPVPGIDDANPKDNAVALSTLLAIHCTALVLPCMTALSPAHLMEFRDENETPLRHFRRAMLKYAGDLNNEISGIPTREIEGKTEFFVKTRILPELDELRESLAESSRSWTERIKDGFQVAGSVIPACFSPTPISAVGLALLKNVPGFLGREVGAAGEKISKRHRSDLYYLLNVERAARDK